MLTRVFVGLLAAVLLGCSFEPSEKERPNILIILTDDQGYGDLASHGNEWLSTPNLDTLGQESVEFERFYVSPVCAPTRASLLTGRYHLATGTSWVTHRKEVMRAGEVTLAELLQKEGYRTGLFGKWHNGKQYPNDPNGQGFDEFLGFKEGHFNNYFDAVLNHNQEFVPSTGYLPDILTDSAMSFMEDPDPFFTLVAYNTPHGPFQVPATYFNKYRDMGLNDKDAAVYGMVQNIDENVGRMLARLEMLGKSDNTIVIFMCDNGPNGDRYNAGLKGWKGHVDEGGVRSPFYIRYPNRNWVSRKVGSGFGAHIDIVPTIAEVVGIGLDSLDIHGISLVDAIKHGDAQERMYFTHQVRRDFDTIPGAVRTNTHVLTLKPKDTALYNLLEDPYQQADLKHTDPETAKELLKAYRTWFGDVTHEGVEPELIETGYGGVTSVELPAQEVVERINLEFKGGFGWSNDYLIDWSDSSQAKWQVRAIADRYYDIGIQLSCDPSPEGRIELMVGTVPFHVQVRPMLVKKEVPSPDRVPRGEVYEYSWPEVKLGVVRIPEGIRDITLRATGMNNLAVKAVQLTLIDDET